MSTVEEEAPVVVGAGGKEEVVAAPEKVGEVMEAAAGEEEMEVAAGEAKKAEGDGEKVDEAKEAGAGEDEMEVAGGEAKKPEGEGEQEQGKAKKRRSRKPRSAAPNHPPYFEMIKEAIMAAGEGKAGASAYAIAKRVGELHGEALPGNYRKVLAAQLRGFVAKGRLVRVKASFRLAPAEEKQALQTKPKSKRAAAATTKKAASKKAAPAQTRAKRGAKKAGPPTAKPKPKQPKSIRARKANKATA